VPFAAIWLAIAWVGLAERGAWPAINVPLLVWTVVAALSQIAATALLWRKMALSVSADRIFATAGADCVAICKRSPARARGCYESGNHHKGLEIISRWHMA
jgi:hypothetical protein